jgi:hypothetical protein
VEQRKAEEAQGRAEKEKAARQEALRKQRALDELKRASAVRIQKIFRGFLTRSIVYPLLLEQRRLNAEADRIRLHQRMDAALTVQAAVRGWRERRNLRRKLAATRIQAVWRGFLCRTGPYLQEYSARVIQAAFRGHYTRNYLAAYLETQALSDAATRIQTKFRTFAVKRRVTRWEMMANTVQAAFRGYIAREYVRKKRVDVYATKLQAVFRGWKGRRKAKRVTQSKEDQAASVVQAVWRGRQCRQAILRDMYHWCSAFQIQRWFRKRQRRRYRAATAIQGMWRGNRAKGEIRKRRGRKDQIIVLRSRRREAAVRMQRWFRAARVKRLPLHDAATKVQAVWRGILGRKIAARERFLFEQKYGNYKEMMLDMYSQIEAHGAGGGGGRDGDDARGGGRGRGGKRKKKKPPTRKELLEENADPFRVSAQSLEDDMGVRLIWLKFDKETANNMAQYFYRRNKPLAALQYIEKSLWQDQRLKQRDFVAKTCLHFSNVLAKLGRHEEALKLAEQSLILFQAEQQLAKQKAAEMGEELLEPMIRANARDRPVGGRGRGRGGGGGGPADEEDEIADTLQAGIAICYHNMAVQQLCCNAVGDATESTEQALRFGKQCIEEWHPWVKQMETTHLACIKLGGGYPDFAAMADDANPVPIREVTNAGGRHQRGGARGGGMNSTGGAPRGGWGRGRVGGGGPPRKKSTGRGGATRGGRRGGGGGGRGRGRGEEEEWRNPYQEPLPALAAGRRRTPPQRRRVSSAESDRVGGGGGGGRGRRRRGRGRGDGSESERSLPDLSGDGSGGQGGGGGAGAVGEIARAMHGPPRWDADDVEQRSRSSFSAASAAAAQHIVSPRFEDSEHFGFEEEGGGGGAGTVQAWGESARVVDWPVSPAGSSEEEEAEAEAGLAMEAFEDRPPTGGPPRRGGSRRGSRGSGRPARSRERFDGDSEWRAAVM